MDIGISKILAPVEFSNRCRDAAVYAEALANQFHAELILLHVVPQSYAAFSAGADLAGYSSVIDTAGEDITECRLELDRFLPNASSTLRVCRMVLEGDPPRKIVEYAHAAKVDLVVMPTHGYGPFRRFLLGSVTAKVLHDVDCPVWTSPHLQEAPQWAPIGVRRVVCAIDLGVQSSQVLLWGSMIANQCGGELSIVHAIPSTTVGAAGLHFDPEWRIDCEKRVRERIAGLQAEVDVPGPTRIEIGEIPAAVTEAARDLRADLLVIGRNHRSGLLGRLRANAYGIIREAHCPVVSV